MEIVISPRNMYQVLFMETLEIVSGIFSGSDFVKVTFSGSTHAPTVTNNQLNTIFCNSVITKQLTLS